LILDIVTNKNELKEKCRDYDFNTDHHKRIHAIKEDFMDTANDNDHCLGLAANQIGYNYRIILPKLKHFGSKFTLMVNPQIAKFKTVKRCREECLSHPGKDFKVRRSLKIKASYCDEDNKEHTIILTDVDAQVVQHGVDHLNGILI